MADREGGQSETANLQSHEARRRRLEDERAACIARFIRRERQRAPRHWISFFEIADSHALQAGVAGSTEYTRTRNETLGLLSQSLMDGEFEHGGKPRVLYLVADVSTDRRPAPRWLRREAYRIALDAMAPDLPLDVLGCSWLRSHLAHQWMQAHGSRWPPSFGNAGQASMGSVVAAADGFRRSPCGVQEGAPMPHVPPAPPERPLAAALAFIQDQDRCTGEAAFAQFQQIAIDGVIRLRWGDRLPAPPGGLGPPTIPSENVGPFPFDWRGASLEAGGRVRFGPKDPVRPILVPWAHFLNAWRSHQSKQPPVGPAKEQLPIHFGRADEAAAKRVQPAAAEPDSPIYVMELAQKLARLPGRLEYDREEARRIAADIAERWSRGEMARNDAVGRYGDPPHWGPLADSEATADDITNLNFWWAAVALTRDAARRYVETCGLAGAERVLREMFGAAAAPSTPVTEPPNAAPAKQQPRRPSSEELDRWMIENVKPGAKRKRDPTIADCRKATGATWREAIAAWSRLPEDLRMKRGEKIKSSE